MLGGISCLLWTVVHWTGECCSLLVWMHNYTRPCCRSEWVVGDSIGSTGQVSSDRIICYHLSLFSWTVPNWSEVCVLYHTVRWDGMFYSVCYNYVQEYWTWSGQCGGKSGRHSVFSSSSPGKLHWYHLSCWEFTKRLPPPPCSPAWVQVCLCHWWVSWVWLLAFSLCLYLRPSTNLYLRHWHSWTEIHLPVWCLIGFWNMGVTGFLDLSNIMHQIFFQAFNNLSLTFTTPTWQVHWEVEWIMPS